MKLAMGSDHILKVLFQKIDKKFLEICASSQGSWKHFFLIGQIKCLSVYRIKGADYEYQY